MFLLLPAQPKRPEKPSQEKPFIGPNVVALRRVTQYGLSPVVPADPPSEPNMLLYSQQGMFAPTTQTRAVKAVFASISIVPLASVIRHPLLQNGKFHHATMEGQYGMMTPD